MVTILRHLMAAGSLAATFLVSAGCDHYKEMTIPKHGENCQEEATLIKYGKNDCYESLQLWDYDGIRPSGAFGEKGLTRVFDFIRLTRCSSNNEYLSWTVNHMTYQTLPEADRNSSCHPDLNRLLDHVSAELDIVIGIEMPSYSW